MSGAEHASSKKHPEAPRDPRRSGPASAQTTTKEAPFSEASADGAGLVTEAISLLDSTFDYFAAKFRLERFRIESQTRQLIRHMVVVLAGVAVLLIGLVFLSVGIAGLITDWLRSPAAGSLIVGGFYLLAGAIALAVAQRRSRIR